MIKQELTPQRNEDIDYSLKKLAILSQLLNYEYKMYLIDTRFKNLLLNNFSGRIGKDVVEIQKRLGSAVVVQDNDHAEEYVGQLWRILDKLCNLDLEALTEHANYLSQELEKVG